MYFIDHYNPEVLDPETLTWGKWPTTSTDSGLGPCAVTWRGYNFFIATCFVISIIKPIFRFTFSSWWKWGHTWSIKVWPHHSKVDRHQFRSSFWYVVFRFEKIVSKFFLLQKTKRKPISACHLLPNDQILVVGASLNSALNSVALYNPEKDVWNQLPDGLYNRLEILHLKKLFHSLNFYSKTKKISSLDEEPIWLRWQDVHFSLEERKLILLKSLITYQTLGKPSTSCYHQSDLIMPL